MPSWSNYHTHSNYCDGKDSLDAYVSKAESIGMKSLGFSSHAPLPFPCSWCMDKEDLPNYLKHIEALRQSHKNLEIYKSLEIDYIPEVISPRNFEEQLDYTIGSIHFVEQLEDGRRWEIDGTHQFFLEGLALIFKNNFKDVIIRYLEITREMIINSSPTIVGHLDKIKIQNKDGKFFNETDQWYRQEINKTIAVIKQQGSIVEINTRGIYQKKSDTTYPSPWIIRLLDENNIPLTINSDAHHPDDLTNHFSEAAKLIRTLDVKKITTLHEGAWKSFSYNEAGIIYN